MQSESEENFAGNIPEAKSGIETEVFNDTEQVDVVARMRHFLADTVGLFETLKTKNLTGHALIRQLALIQARLDYLDRSRYELTELSDIHALRRLRSETAVWIAQKVKLAAIPEDPLIEVCDEIERVVPALNEAHRLFQKGMELGKDLSNLALHSISLQSLHTILKEVTALELDLTQKLQAILDKYRASKWSVNANMPREWIEIATFLFPDSTIHHLPSTELFAFLFRQGPLYITLISQLAQTKSRCIRLIDEHKLQRQSVADCLEMALRGEYLKVGKKFRQLNQIFNDIDYQEVEQILSRFEDWLDTAQKHYEKIQIEVSQWHPPRFTINLPDIIRRRNETLSKLRTLHSSLTHFSKELNPTRSSEFDRDAGRVTDTILEDLWSLRDQLLRRARWYLFSATIRLTLWLVMLVGLTWGGVWVFRMGAKRFPSNLTAELTGNRLPVSPEGFPVGNLDLLSAGNPFRFKIYFNNRLIQQGVGPTLLKTLPATNLTVEFFSYDPIPIESIKQAIAITPYATISLVCPLLQTTLQDWIGAPFTNSIGMMMEWDPHKHWISRLPVTVGQYQQIMDLPVEGNSQQAIRWVTFMDAQEFCQKLTRLEQEAGRLPTNYVYNIPTETEWARFTLTAFEWVFKTKQSLNGTQLLKDITQLKKRDVLGYDPELGAEWLATRFGDEKSEFLLGGTSIDNSRTAANYKDVIGFRCVLVSTDVLRKQFRQKKDIGLSVHIQDKRAEIVWLENDSLAMKAGLQVGDQILRINNKPIFNEEYFDTFLKTLIKGSKIGFQINRNATEPFKVEIQIE